MLLHSAAKLISEQKVVSLACIWRSISLGPYKADKARRLVYQIPVAVVRIGDPKSGVSEVFVMEKKDKRVYNSILCILKAYLKNNKNKRNLKDWMADVLSTTETEAERERIKYVAATVYNTSRRETSKLLGISFARDGQRSAKMEEEFEYVKVISQMNTDLMNEEVADKLGSEWLNKFKTAEYDTSEGDDDEDDENDDGEVGDDYNEEHDAEESDTDGDLDCESGQENLEKEDPEVVCRRITAKWRMRTKVDIAEMRLVKRKKFTKANEISKRHPDIGQVIEERAKQCDIGADKWRRTGVMTFSGDSRQEQRLTYIKLQKYLEAYYKERISVGTVVQLCAVKNKETLVQQKVQSCGKLKIPKSLERLQHQIQPRCPLVKSNVQATG